MSEITTQEQQSRDYISRRYMEALRKRLGKIKVDDVLSLTKCVDLIADEVYRLYAGGRSSQEILNLVNEDFNIITKDDIGKIIRARNKRTRSSRTRQAKSADSITSASEQKSADNAKQTERAKLEDTPILSHGVMADNETKGLNVSHDVPVNAEDKTPILSHDESARKEEKAPDLSHEEAALSEPAEQILPEETSEAKEAVRDPPVDQEKPREDKKKKPPGFAFRSNFTPRPDSVKL